MYVLVELYTVEPDFFLGEKKERIFHLHNFQHDIHAFKEHGSSGSRLKLFSFHRFAEHLRPLLLHAPHSPCRGSTPVIEPAPVIQKFA